MCFLGYSFVHVGATSNAVGVATYISNKLEYHFSPDQYSLNNSECLWLEIKERKSNSKYILGVVYRHPHQSGLNIFLDDFSACLSNLTSSNKPFYILGDLNINISRDNRSAVACKYLNLLLSCGVFAMITKPTRVTNSSTIIDHVLTNDTNHSVLPGIFYSDISDHYPIFCQINKFHSRGSNVSAKSFYRDNQIFRPILTAKTWKTICMISKITIHLLPLTTSMMHLMSLQQ